MSTEFTPQDQARFERMLDLSVRASDTELFQGIGGALPDVQRRQLAEAQGILPGKLVDVGRYFFNSIQGSLHTFICVRTNYCQKKSTFESVFDLMGFVERAVIEALAQSHGLPPDFVRPGSELVSKLVAKLVRTGLNSLCECPD